MADAPQVLQSHQSPHLQHQQAMFKHTAQSPEPMSPYNEMAWPAQPGQHEVKQPTILGMRRHNFWIIVVIAFIIMAATIGGSVGGVLAVQNKKAEAQLAPTATSPATVNTVTIVSSVSAATPSASGSPYVPLSPAEVTRIDNSCGGLSSLQAYDGTQYACEEGAENDPASLTGLVAYTLQQCIDACSTYNYMVSNNTCQAAVLYWNLADKYRDNNGANCFLKPEGSTISQGNATIARRRG